MCGEKQEIFSQNEVDNLLMGLTDEFDNLETNLLDEKEVESTENPYIGGSYIDTQKLFEPTRLPRLEIICDRFAGYATNYLSNLFKTRIELNPIKIEARPFGEVMRRFPIPTSINIVKTNNVFAGNMISVVDSQLVFSFVESAFGGWGSRPRIEGREFTTIEQKVMKLAHERLLIAMNNSWRKFIANITFSLDRTEINPQFSCITTEPEEPCLEIFFEVELDVSLGSIFWIIPISAIKSFYSLLEQYPDNKIRVITCSNEEFMQNYLAQQEKNKNILPTIVSDPNRNWLEVANNIPIPRLAQFLRNDHPQTLACIFSYLKPHIAAQHILTFPAGCRAEIVKRMETLRIRNPIFLQILDDMFSYMDKSPEVLNLGKGKRLLEALSDVSPETKKEIEDEIKEEIPYFFDKDYCERFR